MKRCSKLVAAMLLLVVGGCGGDEAPAPPSDETQTAADEVATTTAQTVSRPNVPLPRFSRPVELTKCPWRDLPHGGGYQIHVRGVSCSKLQKLLLKLGLPIGRDDARAGIFRRGHGWTCWSQYLDKNGPVQNVCWRGERLVVYKVA